MMKTNILQSERFEVLLKGKVALNKNLHPLALSLSDAPLRAVTHPPTPHLPLSVCQTGRVPFPSICYYLLFSMSTGGSVGAVHGLAIPLEAY